MAERRVEEGEGLGFAVEGVTDLESPPGDARLDSTDKVVVSSLVRGVDPSTELAPDLDPAVVVVVGAALGARISSARDTCLRGLYIGDTPSER